LENGSIIIPIVLIGWVALQFTMYGHKGLEIMEKTNIISLLIAICVIVNVSLNFIFVPAYGYIAAAFANLISYLLYPFMVYFVTKSYIKWRIPWNSMAKITFSSLITAGLLAAFKFLLFDSLLNIGLLAVLSLSGFFIYISLL